MTSIFNNMFRSFQMPRSSQQQMAGATRQVKRTSTRQASHHQNARYQSSFEHSRQTSRAHRTHDTQATRQTTRATRSSSRSNVPSELRAYGNGRIPSSKLTSIGGGHKLSQPAADKFSQMKADAAKAGVNIGVTDSYRSYDAQVDVARRKGLYKNGGLAATPGTSKHGWGLAVDVKVNKTGQQWLQNNAAKYGFHTIPREPWHWEYRG